MCQSKRSEFTKGYGLMRKIKIQRLSRRSVLLGVLLLSLKCPALAADLNEVIGLNNQAVKAMNESKLTTAITILETALSIDRTYSLARENLAIAHNTLALTLTEPKEALKHFHTAQLLSPENEAIEENIDKAVKALGKNPKNYSDRLGLAGDAYREGDFIGAYAEYCAALKLGSDALIIKMKNDAAEKIAKKFLFVFPDFAVEATKKLNSAKPALTSVLETDKKSDDYMREVSRKIKEAWKPPKSNVSSITVVVFKINSDGRAKKIALSKSSRNGALDRAALKAVAAASPFPKLVFQDQENIDVQYTFTHNARQESYRGRERVQPDPFLVALVKPLSKSSIQKLKLENQANRATATAVAEALELKRNFRDAHELYKRIISALQSSKNCDEGNLRSYQQSAERSQLFASLRAERETVNIKPIVLQCVQVLSKPQYLHQATYSALENYLLMKLKGCNADLFEFSCLIEKQSDIEVNTKLSFAQKIFDEEERKVGENDQRLEALRKRLKKYQEAIDEPTMTDTTSTAN